MISKALWLAMQNGRKFSEIYSTVSDEKRFKELNLSQDEKDKLKTLTDFVDGQLRLIISESLRGLKRECTTRYKKYKFSLTGHSNCRWDHLTNWEKYTVVLSVSEIFCYLWICPLVKPLVYDIGFFISFTELERNMDWEDRRVIEEKICEYLGKDWITSHTDYFVRREDTALVDDRKNDFKTKGGYVTYKKPIVINQDDTIEDIREQIIQIGNIGFINNIPKMKRYWKELYDR